MAELLVSVHNVGKGLLAIYSIFYKKKSLQKWLLLCEAELPPHVYHECLFMAVAAIPGAIPLAWLDASLAERQAVIIERL